VSGHLGRPILRENRRTELARRLISHGVRTEIISKLTGLTRNRQATVRRRLMVPNKARLRGPTRSPLGVFLASPQAGAEGAALASLCSLFEIPIEINVPSMPKTVSLAFGERLCETYEAYCACYPRTQVQLEELIALRSSLADGDFIRLGKCRNCKCLILVDRFDGNRDCWHCNSSIQLIRQHHDRPLVKYKGEPEADRNGQHGSDREMRCRDQLKENRGEEAEQREPSAHERDHRL
jgi:hypothetical protein